MSWCTVIAALPPAVSASPAGSYNWPVKGRVVTEFRKPTGPYGKGGHQGVDIAASAGTKVRAAGDGKVLWSGELPRGKYVSISHPGGIKTTCLDLLEVHVKPGDPVTKGKVIGTVNGSRDCSNKEHHLHFSASINGIPIDPGMLIEGLDSGSYIRLCPVSAEARPLTPDGVPEGDERGILSGVFEWLGDAGSDTWGLIEEGFGTISNGLEYAFASLSILGKIAWDTHAGMWDDYIFTALKSMWGAITDAARWVWSNPYVRAMAAGFLAAAAVVLIVVAAAVALGVSLVVTIIAAVLAAVACIGMAIYYAVTNGDNVDFINCFWQSFCAGIITGSLALSVGSLSGAFSTGFAKLGIAGISRAALNNGIFSAVFEGASSYLLTGEVTAKGILMAFSIGVLSGAIGATLKAGIAPRKFLEILRIGVSGVEMKMFAWYGAMAVGVRQTVQTVSIMVASVKEVALSIAGRLMYLLYSGSFGASVNVLSCVLSGRDISFESILASFITGVAMGGIALSFGTQGLRGVLARFAFFQEGLGKQLNAFFTKIVEKTVKKMLKRTLESGFKRLSKGKEV